MRSMTTNTTNTTNATNTKRRMTIFIKPSVAKHARTQAIVEELTLSKLVEKALLAYLPNEIVIKKTRVG
jgi:hypothetical protein